MNHYDISIIMGISLIIIIIQLFGKIIIYTIINDAINWDIPLINDISLGFITRK